VLLCWFVVVLLCCCVVVLLDIGVIVMPSEEEEPTNRSWQESAIEPDGAAWPNTLAEKGYREGRYTDHGLLQIRPVLGKRR
jgi:hypothetical protein